MVTPYNEGMSAQIYLVTPLMAPRPETTGLGSIVQCSSPNSKYSSFGPSFYLFLGYESFWSLFYFRFLLIFLL